MENFKIYSIPELVEHYPFKESAIRRFLFHRKTNGLDKAVLKIGKRIYVRKDYFEEWIANHKED